MSEPININIPDEAVQNAVRTVVEVIADRLIALGWEVSKVSLYDEEGIEGWRWTAPDGKEYCEVGSWDEPPPLPDCDLSSVSPATPEATARRWYVGAMNDTCFVIDQPPQPGPVDFVCELDHNVTVIAGPLTRNEAERIVNPHNAALDSGKARLRKLEAALSDLLLPRFDITAGGECKFCYQNYGKDIPKDYLCVNEDCDAFIARAALVESPEVKDAAL